MHQQYREASAGQGGKKGEPGFRDYGGKEHEDAACQNPRNCPKDSLIRRIRRGSWHRTFRRFARLRSSGRQRGKNRNAQYQCKWQPDHPAVQMIQGACRSLSNKDSKPEEHPDVKEIRKGQARDSRSGDNEPEACGMPGPWQATVSGIGILHRRRAVTQSPPWKPPRRREVHAPLPEARQQALQALAGMPSAPGLRVVRPIIAVHCRERHFAHPVGTGVEPLGNTDLGEMPAGLAQSGRKQPLPTCRIVGFRDEARHRLFRCRASSRRLMVCRSRDMKDLGPQASSFEGNRQSLPANYPRKSMTEQQATRATRIRPQSGV